MCTDILKMCMKKFDAEQVFFDKMTGFLTQPFSNNCIMVDSAYFVKSTPLRAYIGSFQHFANM